MGMLTRGIMLLINNISNRLISLKARYKYYRIYPNHIQISKLNQLFGCYRYVWNQSLYHCNKLILMAIKSLVMLI